MIIKNGFIVYYNNKALCFQVQKISSDISSVVLFESKTESDAIKWCEAQK